MIPRRSPLRSARSVLPLLAAVGAAACGDSGTGVSGPPPAPSSVTVEALSRTAVLVTWEEEGGVSRVEVRRAVGTDPFADLATVGGGVGSFRDDGLEPGTLYRYRVRACNDSGCSPFSSTAQTTTFGILAVETSSVPSGVEGRAYSVQLEATGGDRDYTWSLLAGTLPVAVSLSADGVLSGTPGEVGAFAATLGVESGDGQSASVDLTLTIHRALEIVTTSLPDAERTDPYTAGLSAVGGDGAYEWSLEAGALPSGLSLSERGIVSGTPQSEGIGSFTAAVRSGDGQTATRQLSLTVRPAPGDTGLSVDTSILPPALDGAPYDVGLVASDGEDATFTWSVTDGSLPAGLTLDPTTGRIAGTPAAPGSSSFTVRVSTGDAEATASLTLDVVPDDRVRYDITEVAVVPVPAEIRPHVDAAVARWEEVVTGDLFAEHLPPDLFAPGDCQGFGEIVNGTSVEDIVVIVNITRIDGPGGILGQAGPCSLRESFLPLVGALTLDVEDLERIVGTQSLTDLVFHEIGHALGFGVVWRALDLVAGSGTGAPVFTGSSAVERYRALGGSGDVPLESQGGPGTRESHWSEAVFGNEVMTGFLEPVGTRQPLSAVTVASMQDIGYTVDFGAADDFSLSPGAAAAEVPGASLGYDVVAPGPIHVLLPDGRRVELPPLR